MATSTVPSYQCSLCFSSFGRQEHLHRHLVSHGSNRPFPCEFCFTSFKRADVLKRHLRKCKRRAQAIGASIGVVDAPQSSRRRACDRCARQKHACNLANPCQRCIGRNEPCTYRRAQGIVSNTSDEALAAIISRPARRLGPSEDDAIESTLWTGTFASTDLVPVLTPHETSWDIYWPPDIPQLSPCTGVTAGGQGWEACAPPDSANAGFTLSPSPWQDLLEDQTSPIRHDSPPLRPNDTMGTFSFAFLANFTSTTGFVNSFDCGTLDERKLVVRGCSTTDVNKFCIDTSGGEEDYPACFHSGESTCEDSNAVVEALPHIWGIILQEKVLIEGARTKYQRNPQMTPLYTTNWMQPPSEGHCVDPIACTTGNGVTKNLKFDIQSGHRLLSNPLTLMTHEIISRIKEVVSLKPRNSIITLTWSPLLEEICLQFFSPPNLSKYLELYWACWHPNWPVVHKPTFSPASAHPVLVAAMALVGACVSPEIHDNESGRAWFDSVEEMAFSDEDFFDNSRAGSTSPMTFNPSKSRRKVQALQAAYAVCLYQNWEGSDRNKRRIRRYRYSTVIAVARDLGLDSAHHEASQLQDRYVFEWHQFAFREEYIRTLTYIFLLDTAFVMFNNLPPRMVIKELKMDLVCPESCFQAPTADECFVSITNWTSSKVGKRKMSLRSAIETLLGENMDQDTRATFAELEILNLFTMASALHSLIFQYQASFTHKPRLAPLRNAFANWKQVWLLRSGSGSPGAEISADQEASRSNFDPCEMWRRIGFMRYAPEFWLLAKIVLERLEADRHEVNVTNTLVDRSGKPNDILPLESTVLDKYDETSMGQVNDIITMFQRLNV